MKYWYINQLQCVPQDGNLVDFVVVAHWSRYAKETINEKEYIASVYGSQSFSKDDNIIYRSPNIIFFVFNI